MTKIASNPFAPPRQDVSGIGNRKPMLWWLAGISVPAVMTVLTFLIDFIGPNLLSTGPSLLALTFAWMGGWFVATLASFQFKSGLSDKFALCFIASILMIVLMFGILFAVICITGDLGR